MGERRRKGRREVRNVRDILACYDGVVSVLMGMMGVGWVVD